MMLRERLEPNYSALEHGDLNARHRRRQYTRRMPIYEYACMECESHFDELVRSSEQAVTCPECGAANVLKQLSTFAVHGGSSAKSSVAAPAPRSGGGCCGGSCGCGH
jgi:putative FmdB family regulatory protein